LEDSPLPPGEGGAVAPDEGSPLHDDANRRNRGAGCPHPALPRHLLPKGEGLFFDFGQLCLEGAFCVILPVIHVGQIVKMIV